ncbi:MAG TPA: zinc ABC transporter substrate-binding protein, partial [Candidatus Nitrosotalea sp.]|nr:zinc ABC transporter substrate-binding protein [Candidatus Nitrosotalea sp.]
MSSGKKAAAIGGGIVIIIIIAVAIMSSNVFVQNNIQTNLANNNANTSKKIQVIASFFPMYEFTRNVAGDRADVSVFIPIGTEPHGWEPPTQQVQDVQNAQLFIYNGAGMEAFIPAFVSTGNFPNTTF